MITSAKPKHKRRANYFYGYNIVAAGFIVQAVSIGAMFTYGVFFKHFQADLGWSRAAVSGASSLAFLGMGAFGMIAGKLNDKIGPKIILTASGISLGTGYLLMSQLQDLWQLYLWYGLLVGIGFSTHDVITLSTIARWFVRRRGMMTGIVKVGTGCGQMLVPLIAASLVAVFGWRQAYLIIGGFALLILLAVAQVFYRDPSSRSLLPDGIGRKARLTACESAEQGVSLATAIGLRNFWILCMAEFVIFFCLITVVVHIVPHATDSGLSPAVSAGVLATIGGVSMLGRFVMGTVNDKLSGKVSLAICFVLLLCGLIWLQFSTNAWMLYLFAAIYGFAHGGFFTVMSPTVAELFGTGSHGLLFGIVLFCGTIGGAIGPFMAGRSFDATGSYQIIFFVLTGLSLAGLILMFVLHCPQKTEVAQ